MYIIVSGSKTRVFTVFEVTDNGTKLANGRNFIIADPSGTPAGFRLDVDDNLWCGWGMAMTSRMASKSSIRPASRSASSIRPNNAPIRASGV
jgi:sugar lactone lactonase YvrE